MFEKLLDIIASGWHLIAPFCVVVAYQNGGVLRFGKYHRTLPPGFHWKWPLVEDVNTQDVSMTTMRMPPQTLTTLDGRAIIAAVIVNYNIRNIEPYITDITDQKDVLIDTVMGAVHVAIREKEWAAIRRMPPEKEIVDAVRDKMNKYGFKINAITFTDLGEVRSLRLIQPHGKDISN